MIAPWEEARKLKIQKDVAGELYGRSRLTCVDAPFFMSLFWCLWCVHVWFSSLENPGLITIFFLVRGRCVAKCLSVCVCAFFRSAALRSWFDMLMTYFPCAANVWQEKAWTRGFQERLSSGGKLPVRVMHVNVHALMCSIRFHVHCMHAHLYACIWIYIYVQSWREQNELIRDCFSRQ